MTKRRYSDGDIKTLSGLDHIRLRSSMYGFGSFGKSGICLMCKEILDNAIDEASVFPKLPYVINITFIRKRNTFQCIVSDSGRGIPLGKLKSVFTNTNTSGKWGGSYEFSIGSNGIGAKGTVAQSSNFISVSRRPEGMAMLVVKDAKILKTGVLKGGVNKDFGTVVFFEPDFNRMKNAKTFFDPDGGYSDFMELVEFASVNLPNTTINVRFSKQPVDPKRLLEEKPQAVWESLAPRGDLVFTTDSDLDLVGYLLATKQYQNAIGWDSGLLEKRGILVPVTIQTGMENKTNAELGFKVQFLFCDDKYGMGRPRLLSAINMVRMTSRTVSQYVTMTKIVKLRLLPYVDAKYSEFFTDRYILPLHIIVLAEWQHAVFINQDKSEFKDEDFEKGFEKHLGISLDTIPKEQWELLHDKLAPNIKKMWHRKHKRDLRLSSDGKNLAFSLHNPRCYYECKRTGPGTELLICEGVSSGDYVKQLRNPETQAVFELKGKVLNAFRKGEGDLNTLRKNHVISDLLQVLGTSPEDSGLENMRFERIGILADADPDGKHITALVLSDLFHINPKLFDRHIFALNPPLYILNLKGSKHPFFLRNHNSLAKFQAELYYSEFAISLKIGTKLYPLKGDEYAAMCVVIRHLGDLIIDLGVKQHVDPAILEMLVYCVEDLSSRNAKQLAKKLELDGCRFDRSTQTLYLQQSGYETVIPLQGLVAGIRAKILPELLKFNISNIEFILSSKTGTFYNKSNVSIMTIFNMFKQMNTLYRLRRMKGIGEMDKKHLIETCLNPKTRSYTLIKGLGDIQRIEALMGPNSEARKELVVAKIET